MKETGLTGKRRMTTIAATPDDGKSQRKRRRQSLEIGEGFLAEMRCFCPKNTGYKLIFILNISPGRPM